MKSAPHPQPLSQSLKSSDAERVAQCEQCHRPFEYRYRRHVRALCEGCRAENQRTSHAKQRASLKLVLGEEVLRRTRRSKPDEEYLQVPERLMQMTDAEIAKREGVTPQRVSQAFRKGLAKLRKHPELRQAWDAYVKDGCPTPGASPEAGALLLEWQGAISRWYEVLEILQTPETQEEAAELRGLIAGFHGLLGKALEQMTKGTEAT